MSFANNLIYIRQHYGVTQEQIAEQLGVSRQTVSKWEASINYPETDKLLIICDLYNTNLDDLMRGSVKIAQTEDTEAYDAHMNRYSFGIASAVFIIMCGVVSLLILRAFDVPSNISTAAMLVFVVVGVMTLIVSGLQHSEFKRKNATIEPNYSNEVLDRFGKRFVVMMATGIGILMIAVIMLVAFAPEEGDYVTVFDSAFNYALVVALFLFLVGIGVFIIIYAGLLKSKYDRSEITYVMVDGTMQRQKDGSASQNVTPEELRRNHIVGSLCGIIMIAATIVFFVLGFSAGGHENGPLAATKAIREGTGGFMYSWIAFPVGGLLCGIVAIAANIATKSEESIVAEAQKEDPWMKVQKPERKQGENDDSGA